MQKAILVMDMPESCAKCPLFGDHYSDMSCHGLNNRGIDYPYPENFRQKWCPLKPAPQKQSAWCYDDDAGVAWIRGYNNCVREIIGE
jgi:hypothetical protein